VFSKFYIGFSLLCASVFVVGGCTKAESSVSIRGRVIDSDGTPIQRAEISTTPATDVVISNSEGYFVLSKRISDSGESESIKSGRYRVTVRKFGFGEHNVTVTVTGGQAHIDDLVMQPR